MVNSFFCHSTWASDGTAPWGSGAAVQQQENAAELTAIRYNIFFMIIRIQILRRKT
jgi:hypothetical protein